MRCRRLGQIAFLQPIMVVIGSAKYFADVFDIEVDAPFTLYDPQKDDKKN